MKRRKDNFISEFLFAFTTGLKVALIGIPTVSMIISRKPNSTLLTTIIITMLIYMGMGFVIGYVLYVIKNYFKSEV